MPGAALERGGHDKLCKPIKKAGGAEQYNANKKYAEAVAVAAEACADDTEGQTCYICTEAVHRRTGESLVRGCACHTTEGFVHVSCLAEQAKILYAEAEENNLDLKVKDERFARWRTCSLCEQKYHGAVSCALGWACWKTYVARPETDMPRRMAMEVLGRGLFEGGHYDDALSVGETELSTERRLGASEQNMLITEGNLASTYQMLGRNEEALRRQRDVYFGFLKLKGDQYRDTLREANNYASLLKRLKNFEEARSLLRKTVAVARSVLGKNDSLALKLRALYAEVLYEDPAATLHDLREAVTTFEDTERIVRRVFGGAHPITAGMGKALRNARAALRAREEAATGDVSSGFASLAIVL